MRERPQRFTNSACRMAPRSGAGRNFLRNVPGSHDWRKERVIALRDKQTCSRALVQNSAGFSQRRARYHEFKQSSWIGIRQLQFSAKLPGSLLHASDSDSHFFRAHFGYALVNAIPVVHYRHNDQSFPLSKGNPYLVRFRMTKDIRQSLLNNAKHRRFDLRRQAREVGWLNVQECFDSTSLRDSLRIPGEGRQQSHLVEQRWMKEVRHRANLLNCTIDNTARLRALFLCWRYSLQKHLVQDHLRDGKLLPQSIV